MGKIDLGDLPDEKYAALRAKAIKAWEDNDYLQGNLCTLLVGRDMKTQEYAKMYFIDGFILGSLQQEGNV